MNRGGGITTTDRNISSRDQEWFESFFRAHYDRLCVYALRFVESQPDAEEVVQAAFLQLWLHRDEPGEDALRSYIFATVRNRCLDYLRAVSVRRRFVATAELNDVDSEHSDAVVREQEMQDAIDAAIQKLPERRREIFLMSRRDGLTYREIADVLDLSVKTVETQMGRALHHLRGSLAEFFAD